MALAVGTQAPDFTLTAKTADGPQLISLADHKGKSNVLILFFPMAFTGVCTEEFCSVTQGLSDYESVNATVLGISGTATTGIAGDRTGLTGCIAHQG